MADRRFKLGRQGEQLMNDKLFGAYNRIKYIGNGSAQPEQEYQTPILDYSLWVDRNASTDVLKVYNDSKDAWQPMFEGYYHPVDLRIQPMYPVNGQLFIDSNGVLRYYEDKQWKVVAAAPADNISSALMGIANFLIMPDMSVLAGTDREYVVPAAPVGKLFDNKNYIPKDEYYERDIRITYPRESGSPNGMVSWVHVNPAYLYNVRKRLIKILDKNTWFINTPTVNTEFYAFKDGEKVGKFLCNVQNYPATEDINAEINDAISDYRIVSGGIQLMNQAIEEDYDFIYALTYHFDTVETSAGSVLTGSNTIGENNQVYIGQIGDVPLVFVSGLYYEAENYIYNQSDGVLSFYEQGLSYSYRDRAIAFHNADITETYVGKDDDGEYYTIDVDNGESPIEPAGHDLDSNNEKMYHMKSIERYDAITGDLDLVVAAFADVVRYHDLTAQQYNALSKEEKRMYSVYEFEVDYEHVNDKGELIFPMYYDDLGNTFLKQAATFKHPIVFAQGIGMLYDEVFGIKDEQQIDFDFDNGIITIKDYGPRDMTSQNIKLVVADIGDAHLSNGYVEEHERIVDERITEDNSYLLFINGVCIAPSDFDVYNGYIELDDMLKLEGDDKIQYYLMSLDKGDTGIDLLFDASIAYYTFRIEDLNNNSVYNDCDTVVVYITGDGDDNLNGILIDQTALQRNDLGEEFHSTGEILYLKDVDDEDVGRYTYKIFNVNGDYEWTLYKDSYSLGDEQTLDDMMGQIHGEGSVSIISDDSLKGKELHYYAYTYADETDEPILKGTSEKYIFAVQGHRDDALPDATIPDKQQFTTRRIHYYSSKDKGVLSTYVNGLHLRNYEQSDVDCKYTIPTHNNLNFIKTWGSECDLYNLIKAVDDDTGIAKLQAMKDGEFNEELKNFSITDDLLLKLRALHNVVVDMEDGETVHYYVERIEQGEAYSADRVWCTVANRYAPFANTYTSSTYIGPGNVDIYLNGVMLDRSSYSIFDSHNVILNDLNVAGGSDEYDPNDPETLTRIKYYVMEHDEESNKLVGKTYKMNCTSPDEVLVEYKPDTSLRKTSYEIKESTYDSGILAYDDYEFPNSLLNTKDEIKIWIDGILYTGGYTIRKKDIILKNSPLQPDPIKLYFDLHPDTYKEWKKENGEYVYRKSRIIFEWR